jgi:RHS repeat-associated protein
MSFANCPHSTPTGGVYAYSHYGETTVLGPDEGNPLQYTGRENDGTGLYYYRARYYDPGLKRFVGEDPIRISGGVILYGYVSGNPTNLTDPLGLMPFPGIPTSGMSDMQQRAARAMACAQNPAACQPPPPQLPQESDECVKCVYEKVSECQDLYSEGGVPRGASVVVCTLPPAMQQWKEACKPECECPPK